MDPIKNLRDCEDFLLIALHSHTVAAANALLSEDKQYKDVTELATAVVEKFCNFDLDVKRTSKDKVYLYGKKVLNLGILWCAFDDAIKEGDGDRVLRYWKLLLIVFKAKRHTNYSKEAIVLLSQYHCRLSGRKAAQLKWSRFINTKGIAGGNISCDLHLEHLNCRLKGMIAGICSNGTNPETIDRAARSLGVVNKICNTFECQNDIPPESDRHKRPSFIKDFKLILELLEDRMVFKEQPGRSHSSFKKIQQIFQHCSSKELSDWISKRLKSYKNV